MSQISIIPSRQSSRLKVKNANRMPAATNTLLQFAVFVGGKASVQETAFKIAAAEFADRVQFDYIDVEQVKKSNWTEEDFARRLVSNKHAHMLLSHPLEGLLVEMGWNSRRTMTAFVDYVAKHPGYPSSNKLLDNTLWQNKYETIQHLGADVTIPSLKIFFSKVTPTTLSYSVLFEIHNFAANNDEGCGFTVKLPHMTNSMGVQHGLTIEGAISVIIRYQVEYGMHMEYVILQCTLQNRYEFKVMFDLNGFSHFCYNHIHPVPAFVFASDAEVIMFASEIIRRMKLDPKFLDGPMVRVDVMCRANRRSDGSNWLVCNELESLHAMVDALPRFGGERRDFQVFLMKVHFWKEYIHLCAENIDCAQSSHA